MAVIGGNNDLPSQDMQVFATAQAASIWEAILTCWNPDVFIPELGHRFWKLTLQVGNNELRVCYVESELAQAPQQVQTVAWQPYYRC